MLNEPMPVAQVGTPPLIAAPAHQWQTLLTVLMQTQNISVKVVGPTRKTVVSLDMGLYQPAKKLQMTRQDLGHIILRPGELHIVMAQLRTIGAFIENSGLDKCWVESDLYGPSTVKQLDSRWEPYEERRSSAHGYITSSLQPLPGSVLCEAPRPVCARLSRSRLTS